MNVHWNIFGDKFCIYTSFLMPLRSTQRKIVGCIPGKFLRSSQLLIAGKHFLCKILILWWFWWKSFFPCNLKRIFGESKTTFWGSRYIHLRLRFSFTEKSFKFGTISSFDLLVRSLLMMLLVSSDALHPTETKL